MILYPLWLISAIIQRESLKTRLVGGCLREVQSMIPIALDSWQNKGVEQQVANLLCGRRHPPAAEEGDGEEDAGGADDLRAVHSPITSVHLLQAERQVVQPFLTDHSIAIALVSNCPRF